MSLSNFNRTLIDHDYNFEGINVIQTVFTVIITIYNTFLASMIVDNKVVNFTMTLLTWFLVITSILSSNFQYDEFSTQATATVSISVIFICVMVPSFMLITSAIGDEIIEEARASYMDRDNFRRMFDAL